MVQTKHRLILTACLYLVYICSDINEQLCKCKLPCEDKHAKQQTLAMVSYLLVVII